MKRFDSWRKQTNQLKQEVHAIYLAYKDPRVPWYAKALAVCVVAYAFSPIDLIPDFIPVLGYLDDLLLVRLGIYFVLKLIPNEVMTECRVKALAISGQQRPTNRLAPIVIVIIWIILAVLSLYFIIRAMRD